MLRPAPEEGTWSLSDSDLPSVEDYDPELRSILSNSPLRPSRDVIDKFGFDPYETDEKTFERLASLFGSSEASKRIGTYLEAKKRHRAALAAPRVVDLSMVRSSRGPRARGTRSPRNRSVGKNQVHVNSRTFVGGYLTTDTYTTSEWKYDYLSRTGGLSTSKPYKTWTNYYVVKYTMTAKKGFNSWTNWSGSQVYTYYSEFYYKSWLFANLSASMYYTARGIAWAKLLSKMTEHRNAEWQASVTLGEGRETVQSFVSVARRLAHAYLSLRKGSLEGLASIVGFSETRIAKSKRFKKSRWEYHSVKTNRWQSPAKLWMEYSYAIRPLVGDVYSAAEYFAKRNVDRQTRPLKLTGRHEVVDEGHESFSYVPGIASPGFGVRLRKASVKVTAFLKPRFTREPNFIEQCGFTDPWSVAWELLPLSFVVDWFVNVGEVLTSLAEFSHWEFIQCIESRSYTHNEDVLAGRITSDAYNRYENFGGWVNRYRESSRETVTPPTAVDLRWKLSNPFSTPQVLSALSLLQFAFSGTKRP